MIDFIKNIFLTARLSTSSVAGLLVTIILIYSEKINFVETILFGIIFSLITMFGFVINDILDYKKDRMACRKRPIAQDKISRKSSLFFSSILVVIIFSLEYLLGNNKSTIIVILTIALLTFYSLFSQKLPILKGVITGILCFTPLLYASSIIDVDFNFITYFIVMLFIFGRELYMDAQDYKGDKLSNLKTIPYYLGIVKCKFIGFTAMLLSLLILVYFSYLLQNTTITILSLLGLLVMLASIAISFKDEEKAISLTKLSILLAVIPLFSLAI